ncbi:formylglycine-generating enzyme family protein [Baaleninema simplex]|uniref:formylglycine-generating enzyme family protein n=1 Tax=Baaleninema simplex TaxID=2862350 RepID=UPI00034A7007|nr:formylglycine-generating enzyme family protein [Baaleninema simplex]
MSQATQYVLRRRQRTAQQYREDLGNGVTLEMVWIPGGTFLMGSPEGDRQSPVTSHQSPVTDEERFQGYNEERPQHEVTVPSFFMGKYPVTQAQWRAVATGLPKVKTDLNSDPSSFKGDNRPVEQVNWFEAVEFCQRLARLAQKTKRLYRLPSEAEWEYACRAGTTTPYHFGETITQEVASFSRSYDEGTTVVGSYQLANAFGLYDMHGNVWEWCYDQWHDSYSGAPPNERPWIDNDNDSQKRRLLRGGSWDDYPWFCRSANRLRDNPDYRYVGVGFRLCCSVARTLS